MAELRIAFWLLLASACGLVLYLLAPVLTPFLLSAVLAYLGDPLIDRLERLRFSRTAAVVAVFCLIFAALIAVALLLVPALERQVLAVVRGLPAHLDALKDHLGPWLRERIGLDFAFLDFGALREQLAQQVDKVGSIAASVLGSLSQSTAAVLGWLANGVLVPVVTFYLLRDWDVLVMRVRGLLPRPLEPRVSQIAAESDTVLGAFLRGQFSVMLALGAIYALGLMLVELEAALLIGLLAGLVSFVPYLGFIVGVAAAGFAAALQFGDLLHLGLVVAVFAFGQAVEGMLLTPWLVGDRIGLHPVAVIFAVLAGGQLFGFMGVLLALPVAAVIAVLLRHTLEGYRASGLYEGEGPG